MRIYILAVVSALLLVSTPCIAGWHYLEQVTQVTVFNDQVYVRGTNPTGYSCTNHNGFYGTLFSPATDSAHKIYYSLALTAYALNKGFACYVYHTSSGVCQMENCYIP